jgi:hypothetical protein
MRKRIGALCVSLIVAGLATTAAAAPTSLEGTELDGLAEVTHFECGEAGGTVVFTANGESRGTNAGTFEATVTVTSGPLTKHEGDNWWRGTLQSIEESFTIVSGGSVITGTKTLDGGGEFLCRRFQSSECDALEFGAYSDLGGLAYTASTGDYGRATVSADAANDALYDCAGSYASFGVVFHQQFVDSLAPTGPAQVSDCKDGGWATYGTFSNQGECVSSLNRTQQDG